MTNYTSTYITGPCPIPTYNTYNADGTLKTTIQVNYVAADSAGNVYNFTDQTITNIIYDGYTYTAQYQTAGSLILYCPNLTTSPDRAIFMTAFSKSLTAT
jgi:hypothetical protein